MSTVFAFVGCSDPIRTWTQLQSLSFKGDMWDIDVHVDPEVLTAAALAAADSLVAEHEAVLAQLRDAAAANAAAADAAETPRGLEAVAAAASATASMADERSQALGACLAELRAAMAAPSSTAVQAFKDDVWKDKVVKWSWRWGGALAAAVGSLTQLTELDASGWCWCGNVTKLQPLTRLRSLNLSNTDQSDFSLLGLLPVLSCCTQLSIAGNPSLTAAPLAALPALLPDLRVLDVQRIPSIGSSLMEQSLLWHWMRKHPEVKVWY